MHGQKRLGLRPDNPAELTRLPSKDGDLGRQVRSFQHGEWALFRSCLRSDVHLLVFRAGEGVDLIRESVRMVMQELIEAEATERIGAGRYERAEAGVTDRKRCPAAAGRDPDRRHRAADPDAAQGPTAAARDPKRVVVVDLARL